MRTRRRAIWPKLLIVALLLCAACACAETSGSQKNAPEPPPREPLAGAELVAGYKGWARVNPEPAIFHLPNASDCAAPSGASARMATEDSPHIGKFINVFVNDAGRRAMLKELRPHFPVGSLIVKEKLPTRDAAEPELLTAMYKRETGYDPEGGDWEYLVLDGHGKEVQTRGKLESCRACHQAVADTDFVSRNYLTSDLRRKLK
jgi:hypothetical protein